MLSGMASWVEGSNIWLRNLYDPLVELGHEVELLNIDEFALGHDLRPLSPEAKDLLSNELPGYFMRKHKENKFNLFLSYLHNDQIFPEVFKEIKRQVFTVNYTTNYHQFSMYEDVARITDLNIYASKVAKDGFDRIGAKSYWMPFAANQDFYKPINGPKANEILFIGSVYGIRPYLLWRALQNDINLHIYGPGWWRNTRSASLSTGFVKYLKTLGTRAKNIDETLVRLNGEVREKIIDKLNQDYPGNIHSVLTDSEYAQKLASASIIVNIIESRFNHDFLNPNVLLGCNLRTFETTMSGAFLCIQFCEELNYFFEDGKEVVSFRNEYELVDKLKYYLIHETERNKIAMAGYNRAIKDHTWKNRFISFFVKLKI